MKRINVYSRDESATFPTDERPGHHVLEGWFDEDKAEKFAEAARWDDHNWISVATGSQWDHEVLLRTAKGRWVLNEYSNRVDTLETYTFISDERAKEWLLLNDEDDAVTKYFGEIEEERGPGRPEVGAPVNVRLDGELLAKVDAHATDAGIPRAAAIRQLLAAALA